MKLGVNYRGALGDVLCLSAAVRSWQMANPAHKLAVVAPFAEVFDGYGLFPLGEDFGQVTITEQHYRDGAAAAADSPRHVVEFFHDALEKLSGLPCPVAHQAPKLLTGQLPAAPVTGNYWVLFAGGKHDIPLKLWSGPFYQQIADFLRSRGRTVVQTGRTTDRHVPLTGVTRLFDRSSTPENLRRLFSLIRNCEGVVCPITSGMHLAAAFNKPCVVLAGGREDPWWEAYNNDHGAFDRNYLGVPHVFLHTVGELSCCRLAGCWRRDFAPAEALGCDRGVTLSDFPGKAAECMMQLTPELVIAALENYL